MKTQRHAYTIAYRPTYSHQEMLLCAYRNAYINRQIHKQIHTYISRYRPAYIYTQISTYLTRYVHATSQSTYVTSSKQKSRTRFPYAFITIKQKLIILQKSKSMCQKAKKNVFPTHTLWSLWPYQFLFNRNKRIKKSSPTFLF